MVAISVYKGNLHRAPNTPRQCLRPTGRISPKDFRDLIRRRSRALARLQSTDATTSDLNFNPNPNHHQDHSATEPPVCNGSLEHIVNDTSFLKIEELIDSNAVEVAKDGPTCDDDALLVIPGDILLVPPDAPDNDANTAINGEQKTQATSEHQLAPSNSGSLNDKEKRKKEVEEKLQMLNERKHKLVQVLKQILNAEEELRRRSNVQGITGRPAVSLQVDVTNDSGSMSRHVTPRPVSEGADVAGADADDVSNHNLHSRNIMRMSSMSPSSDSLLRRTPFSMVPNASRGVVASSPSRFAPTWNGQQQQNGGNLSSVSVSGTNYVVSSPSPSPSPSPAGSGGTSVFRDAAITSPWN